MINACCPFFSTVSYGQHARGFLHALNRMHPVALIPFGVPPPGVPEDVRRMLDRGRAPDPRQPALTIGGIGDTARAAGAWRIGFVVWETTRLPDRDVSALRALDEIWTPSSWGRRILIDNGLDEERVHVVPEGIDPVVYRPSLRERDDDRPFRFLCVGRWTIRKGVDELVRAYAEEFAPDERVELVLHCADRGYRQMDLRPSVARAARGPHPPILAGRPLPEHAMAELYRSCDAFVLPTRGEGWGLPVVEAMACGLPVIVTDYSAPTDYLNGETGYPLRATMVDVRDPYFGPNAGQWAQPDAGHLRALMRHVFENRGEARAKGAHAAEVVRREWTWDRAAEKAYALLEGRIASA